MENLNLYDRLSQYNTGFLSKRFLGLSIFNWLFVIVFYAVILWAMKKFLPRLFRKIPFYGKISTTVRRGRGRLRRYRNAFRGYRNMRRMGYSRRYSYRYTRRRRY